MKKILLTAAVVGVGYYLYKMHMKKMKSECICKKNNGTIKQVPSETIITDVPINLGKPLQHDVNGFFQKTNSAINSLITDFNASENATISPSKAVIIT